MKATVVLFFFLGMNSLLFCINPKDQGIYEDAYMVTNAILKGSQVCRKIKGRTQHRKVGTLNPLFPQGSIVCIFYCVLSNDVRMAVKKRWYQWKVRRDHARDQQRQGGRQILFSSADEQSFTTRLDHSGL